MSSTDGRLEFPPPRLRVVMFSLCQFRCLTADVGDDADHDVCREISKQILFIARHEQFNEFS